MRAGNMTSMGGLDKSGFGWVVATCALGPEHPYRDSDLAESMVVRNTSMELCERTHFLPRDSRPEVTGAPSELGYLPERAPRTK